MDSGFFGDDQSILKLIVVMLTHLCEYTKNHGILHFKMVNFMVCEFVIKKLQHQKTPRNIQSSLNYHPMRCYS